MAAAATLLVGFNGPPGARLTSAFLVGFLLLPVWVGVLRRFANAQTIVALGLLALANGVLLAYLTADSRWIDAGQGRSAVLLLVTTIVGLGVLLWARTRISMVSVALLYGVGSLVAAVPAAMTSPNPWKYYLAVPVSVVVLSLAGRLRPAVALSALAILAVIGALADTRSQVGACLLSGLILAWQARSRSLSTRRARVRGLAFAIAAAYALYLAASEALLAGWFGEESQQRTLAQADDAGDLLVGGRPEIAATLALIRHFPQGFGVGAVPTLEEVLVAKDGLAAVGLVGRNGYVDNFMLGDGFELHSVLGDLWARFGISGLALGAYVGAVLLWSLTRGPSDPAVRPVAVFTAVVVLWELAFGPLYTSAGEIVLALALALAPRGPASEDLAQRVTAPPDPGRNHLAGAT